MRIDAWRVHDTGLVAAPGPFRRLPGGVRHHQGRGAAWPDQVTLELIDDELVVSGVGRWPVADVGVRRVAPGPPVSFIIHLPDADHLLAAAAGEATERFLADLAP